MKWLLTILTVSALLVFAGTQTKTGQATAATAEQAVKAKGIWVDVRTPEEFATGNIQGALNIPVDQISGQIHRVIPDKHTPIHVYCRSGRRSAIAVKQLKELGYTDVTNHGSYQDLLQQGIR